MKKNPAPLLIVMLIAVLAAAGVGYALMPKGDTKVASETEAAAVETAPQEASVEKQFEDLLNELLNTVRERMNAYGAQRKLLVELVKPDNLDDPSYIEENYALMQELAMDLHTRTAELLHSFEKADETVGSILATAPEGYDASAIQAKWDAEKKKHYDTYNEFFSFEEKIIQQYQDLMTFYKIKQGSYSIDPGTGEVVFESADDQARVAAMHAAIKDLSQEQGDALRATND